MLVRIIVLLLALTLPTTAQQPASPRTPVVQPPAAKPPKPDPVAESYAAMPEAERIGIQTDLIWTGDYVGTAGAEFGARAIAAVKAFQKRQGGKESGVLNPKERVELAAAAKKKRDAVGWRIVEDKATGARLGIPAKLAPQSSTIAGGSRWASARNEVQVETFRITAPGTTLPEVYEQQRKIADRKISYNILRPDFFVVSGLQGGVKKFYVRAHIKDGEVRGFTLAYDQAMANNVDPVVIGMSSAFAPFPASPAAAAAPPPRRKVEYGTAVIVDAGGHALTTQHLIDGCQTITLAGLGPADIVVRDQETGLALLRLYGARNLTPLALAEAAPPSELTLVGVADPQAQGGGGAVSAIAARLNTANPSVPTIEPAPTLGFAGAAAIDRAGRLAGLVNATAQVVAGPPTAGAQAALIPAAAVKKFLAAHNVSASDVGSAAEGGKTSVARVICVRK